jgi:hypothetical protein
LFSKIFSVALVLGLAAAPLMAADGTKAEIDSMKKELEELRKELAKQKSSATPIAGGADKAVAQKYGPNNAVTTKTGKLKIGGMVQIWYYSIQNDQKGLFDNEDAGIVDINDAVDNDSFQVRRAELSFNMDIHENITAYMMMDFAREFDAFGGSHPQLAGNNQGFVKAGLNNKLAAVRAGTGSVPRILQDAIINYHGVVPHHDFTVGQFLPFFSEEDFGPNSVLDFVERSWIGNFYPRDLGVNVHGSWWDNGGGGPYCGGGDNGRFQYWLSAFNGTTYYNDGGTQNRSDDNDSKDFLATVLVRPVWKQETWGSLEIGSAYGLGKHGEQALGNGLNRKESWGHRYSGWLQYSPGSIAKGLRVKGEYAWIKDRTGKNPEGPGLFDPADSGDVPESISPFEVQGYYIAGLYNLGNSVFADDLPGFAKGFEFGVRFQRYDGTWTKAFRNTSQVDTHPTSQWTIGVNYYIKGHNAKIQMNYDIVDNPDGYSAYKFHDVRNDFFSVNFQVMW